MKLVGSSNAKIRLDLSTEWRELHGLTAQILSVTIATFQSSNLQVH